MKIPDGYGLVKLTSHRSREKLLRLLDEKPKYYFSFSRNGEWALIPQPVVEDALKITGVKPCGNKLEDLQPCWSNKD